MNEIKMIPIDKLTHHPENPRKVLGDLSELTESIRKNGVMQNLTVIEGRYRSREEFLADCKAEGVSKAEAEGLYSAENSLVTDGKYTVVIGNRRMEAAKKAGLEALPCVISSMDHRAQIATMLEENMQRSDLTLYEQAQGFQMMMDLGFSETEISEKTGFSRTTVNRRLKMAKLNEKTLQQAVRMQITIADLDKLSEIEDIKERNKLLASFGESNYSWLVNQAIKRQKADKMRPKAMKMNREADIKPIPEKDKYSIYGKYESKSGWDIELDKWDGKSSIIPKEKGALYYRENGTEIEIYRKIVKQKAEPVKKTPEELEEEKRIDLAWRTVERIQKTAREMRMEYAKKLKVTPSNAMEMLQWALIGATVMTMGYNTPKTTLLTMAGLEKEYVIPNRERELFKYIWSLPQSRWPELIFLLIEGEAKENGDYYTYGSRREMPKWEDCPRVNICYQWLRQFGYRMSDEEEQMQTGTHEIFREKIKEAGE